MSRLCTYWETECPLGCGIGECDAKSGSKSRQVAEAIYNNIEAIATVYCKYHPTEECVGACDPLCYLVRSENARRGQPSPNRD